MIVTGYHGTQLHCDVQDHLLVSKKQASTFIATQAIEVAR